MAEDKNIGIKVLLETAGAPTEEASAGSPVPSAEGSTAEVPSPSAEGSTAAAKPEKEETLEDIVKAEAIEADDQPASSFSLSRTLGGVIIAKAIQKQIWLVLLITLFLIIYISNRYICQQQIVKIDKMERELVEMKYKGTVCKSILTEKSRESNIMRLLEEKGDCTLTVPTTPPYKIIIDN